MTNFAKKLKQARKDCGLTQKEVAEQIEVTRSLITQFECGYTKPSYEVLIRLANLYKVSIDYLFDR